MELATAFNDAWHRQPDPADRSDGRQPSNPQWVLVSALWLLAAWAPAAAPGWVSTLVLDRTGRRDEPWPPPTEQLAAIADLPEVSGAFPYASIRSKNDRTTPPEELVSRINEVTGVDDAPRRSLVRYLVDRAVGRYGDLLLLTTTREDPALHLLHRDYFGTARITLVPAPTVQQPPVIADDGADGALRTRIACLATLLSEHLMVDNNNPVDFRFLIGTLPEHDDDRLGAATRLWSATREDTQKYADEAPTFCPITFTDLRTSLHNIARLSLVDDPWEDSWDGIDECPEIPAGHIITHLVDDLVDVIEDRLGGALVAAHGFLPTAWPPPDQADGDGDDECIYVLFVRGNEVGILEIDGSC